MPRGSSSKIDELLFQKPNYWGQVFMYNSACWKVLYPIVDLIRIFPKPLILKHGYKKNQQDIKLYGQQYGHLVTGIDFAKKEDYVKNLKLVKIVFVFSDVQDNFADNLINYCKLSKTPLVCYSSLDSLYHFYIDSTKECLNTPEQVIEKMEEIKQMKEMDKLNQLFPEFDLLNENEKKEPVLDNCIKILNDKKTEIDSKKVFVAKVPFDANFNKLKKIEHNKKKEKETYDDEPPKQVTSKKLLSEFFKKR